jgi:signal transduction histidine kinase
LQQMHKTSQGMAEMVESLLALARTNQAPVKAAVSVTDLLNEVARVHETEAEVRHITLELQPQDSTLHGDRAALQLALGNLARNAIKYGRDGGHVWLSSGETGNEVFLTVSDDGPGIPKNELERLRQPFQRGTGLQGVSGSGLGLALAAAVAEQHGGRLELAPATQGGLRATLWLPNK